MRGFAASRLGWGGAIVLTSACWAALHVQYEVFFLVQVFLLGLVLGWLRWASGSTTLTLGLHALINLSALIETAIIVEWLS
jgi:membrane protease YdiL (CAAX protease family)